MEFTTLSFIGDMKVLISAIYYEVEFCIAVWWSLHLLSSVQTLRGNFLLSLKTH